MNEGQLSALPSATPELPIVYLDWNVVQFLRKRPEFGRLLEALLECRTSGAAILPYSVAHILDATALWTRLSPEHRHERLRDLVWMDGFSSALMWEIVWEQPGQRHVFRFERFLEACRSRGHMESLSAMGVDGRMRAEADAWVGGQVEGLVSRIRELEAGSEHMPPGFADAMIDVAESTLGDGLPEFSDTGRNHTALLAPALLHAADTLPAIGEVAPGDAVALIEERLAEAFPGFSFIEQIDAFLENSPNLDPDDLGPGLLNFAGYERERRQDVRRAAPGLMPDQVHGRHALAAAIFLTGERRLPRRLEAWAAFTGRGGEHNNWPVILRVKPGDLESVERAAVLIEEFSGRFEGLAARWLGSIELGRGGESSSKE